ncbi:YncE family protein [Spirosoma sp. KNUC1025]|uniref:YncE family protein n=1 Tax=Spirosoma sp. KNUC1025 TaxID=2894082 RepID=UPI00386B03B9|nr:DUF5074 domain-containing protein [Spirosoma sp. KNUC1025]
MKKQLTREIALGLLALSVWNCKTSDPEPTPYDTGVYIMNQGNFSDNNGSLSYLPRVGNTVQTNIFVKANPSLTISGGVQDFTEVNGKGLLLVDNTAASLDKVEIVESGSFKTRTTLKSPDIENPRRVVQVGLNKAYISCWDVSGSFSDGSFFKDPGYIAVVDLNTGTVTKKIPAVKGVEAMVVSGTEVFAGSVGYSGDNNLAIINTETNEVKQKIAFSASPQPVAVDADGKLWVLAGSEMIRMDIPSRSIEKRLTLPASPGAIAISRDKRTFFYSANNRTYKFTILDATASTAIPVFNRAFSALGADPQTGRLYGSVIPSYKQAGYVLRYEESGALIDSVKAEIAPSGFYFR